MALRSWRAGGGRAGNRTGGQAGDDFWVAMLESRTMFPIQAWQQRQMQNQVFVDVANLVDVPNSGNSDRDKTNLGTSNDIYQAGRTRC